ncbi:MAG: ABC transporter substrate-binding protein [Thermomicrobiales bacterium]
MTSDRFSDLLRAYQSGSIDRRRFLQTAAALGVTATAVGTTMTRAQPARAQETEANLVTVSTEQEATWVRNFNPLVPTGSSKWPTESGVYEPLIVYNTMTGEIVPWLATAYEFSGDNTQLTFTIREGVTWSDGTPFTAQDVKFTFDYLTANEDLSGSGAVRATLSKVSAVEAPDDTTVVFTFSEVYTPGLYDLGHQTIVPQHIWSEITEPATFTNETPVGTGPFTEIGVFEAQYYEILKNPNYWQEGKPLIDGMRFPTFPTNDQANLGMVSGEIDWASHFVPDIENTYIAEDPEHFNYWFPPTGATVHLFTNTGRAPFDNPEVRKAVSLAINRDQIVDVAMYNYTHAADVTGLSDAYPQYKTEELLASGDWVQLNVDRANELLDAAGLALDGDVRVLPDESRMEYEILVVSGWSDWVSACQIMAQNLEEIGIRATVKTYDFSAWIDLVQKGDFNLSIGWTEGGATPFNFYRGLMSTSTLQPEGTTSPQNWHRYANEEADTLLNQFAATSNPEEQIAIVQQLAALYIENAPAIPLFPGPQWGEYSTRNFIGFPDEENPYALLSCYANPDALIVLNTIEPAPEA